MLPPAVVDTDGKDFSGWNRAAFVLVLELLNRQEELLLVLDSKEASLQVSQAVFLPLRHCPVQAAWEECKYLSAGSPSAPPSRLLFSLFSSSLGLSPSPCSGECLSASSASLSLN